MNWPLAALLLFCFLPASANACPAPWTLGPLDPWTFGPSDKQPPAQPVNINTASEAELQKLPGVGPSTARAIIRHRTRNGPFRRVEDLLIIRGISRARLNRLRPYITVGGANTKPRR